MVEHADELKALRELETLLNAAIPSFRWSSQVNLKLERIQSLVELLGNPQTSYPAIHIGGTSGKGTVAAMTASILSHHGRRTGLHLSPYVQTLTETWQLDGRYSLPSRILPVARLVTETAKNIPLMPASGPVSYFELNVAIALQLFAEERVDTAIIEVGLGGTRDATNVISADVAMLTNVGLDHTEVLGDTVEKIAAEKVGIFKPGSIIVSGVEQLRVKAIAREKAAQVGARLLILDDDIVLDSTARELVIKYDERQLKVDVPAAWPSFQRRNAALAIVAACLSDPSLSPTALSRGVEAIHLPGRFERFEESQRTIVLDGAHNPAKVRSVISGLDREFPGNPCTGVVALKEDKDARAILSELSPLCSTLVLTTFNTELWQATSPTDLAALLQALNYEGNIIVEPDPSAAIETAIGEAPAGGVVLVVGSLYLAGNIRPRWVAPLDDILHGASFQISEQGRLRRA